MQAQKTSSEEIDLREFFLKIVRLVKKNFRLILSFFIGGTILGFTYGIFGTKIYESKMMVTSDILTESYGKTLISDFETLIKEKNYNSIALKLHISPDQAAALNKIEIKSAIEREINTKEQDKIYLTVTCQSADNTLWPDLQDGLIMFLESNDFVKLRVTLRKRYYDEIIEKVEKELIDLNELKLRIVNNQITQPAKENIIIFDPTTVNSKIIELNKELVNLQNGLETVNSVQLVNGFTVFEKPVRPKLSISLAGGATLGLFLVGFLIAFKSIRAIVRLADENEE